ncbi:uncharacterized protein LOC120436250 isoform X1 [Oreochromis aureus]|uniref:uncharacterized protein LOC120436250 isoform X1 n=1 Tax=Oreochromis aureus TaxID=47969 RepID=UPI0019549548|nr:uncharacterized protein LOC120436250 isoform X1 [Oreochromis aureus]
MFIVLTFFLLWPVGLYPAFPLKISCMPELTYHIFLSVKRLWAAKDTGRLESVVGSYKLFDSSFRTLQGSRWLSDEVIDAYLHRVIERRKNAVHLLCSVVASSLFSGQFRCLTKMKFPVEDMWLCPVNFGTHWILVIVNISAQKILLIDPMGNEGVYDRKILRNWRNFLRMRGHEDTMEWQLHTMQHNKQQDSSSCGVLLLKFAEQYLAFGEVSEVLTTTEAVVLERMQIACTLLEHRGNAEDYCIVCSMLDADADRSMIEMVQCESCQRWAHFACANYKESNQEYKCKKCKENT